MKLLFVNMTMLLLTSIVALSCYKEPVKAEQQEVNYTLVLSGTASDKETSDPLEGIKITIYAAGLSAITEGNTIIKSTHTDSRGFFTMSVNGFTEEISCTLTSEDLNGIYGYSNQNLKISWSGPSFDHHTNFFYVNDCNFYLDKILR